MALTLVAAALHRKKQQLDRLAVKIRDGAAVGGVWDRLIARWSTGAQTRDAITRIARRSPENRAEEVSMPVVVRLISCASDQRGIDDLAQTGEQRILSARTIVTSLEQ